MKLNTYIDHTVLKPYATTQDIRKLCEEAKEHEFYAVCINGCHIPVAREELENSAVKIASVVGFPLGAMSTSAKMDEAKRYTEEGADEIDMVMNLGWFRDGDFSKVEGDIAAVKMAIDRNVLKVIIETCYLTEKEIRKACELVVNAGADFVKTSTGFGIGGATFEDVKIMKETVGDRIEIKASGGIKDAATAKEYIAMGVSRIGTSSGIDIVNLNN